MIAFYKSILKSVNLDIDKEYKVITNNGTPKMVKGLQLVLPRSDLTSNSVEWSNEEAAYKPKYVFFHPLVDDIGKVNVSLRDLKWSMVINLTASLTDIMFLLTQVVNDPKNPDIPYEIQEFLSTIKLDKKIKKRIDDKWGKAMTGLFQLLIKKDRRAITLISKKNAKINGGKVIRALVLDSQLLDTLIEEPAVIRDELGLENKHIEIMRKMLMFVFKPWLGDNSCIAFSNDGKLPTPKAVLIGYVNMVERFNSILTDLEYLDNKLSGKKLKIYYDIDKMDELDDVSIHIPDTFEVVKSKKTHTQHSEVTETTENLPNNGYYRSAGDFRSKNGVVSTQPVNNEESLRRIIAMQQQQLNISQNNSMFVDNSNNTHQPVKRNYLNDLLTSRNQMNDQSYRIAISNLTQNEKIVYSNFLKSRQQQDNRQGFHMNPDIF